MHSQKLKQTKPVPL